MTYAYWLFIKTPVTKFTKNFRLGKFSYLDYKPMLSNVYALPIDKKNLQAYLKFNISYDFYFDFYNKSFKNIYFLKDLYSFGDKLDLIKYYKIIGFYDKIFSIIIMLMDPFFFKYYWKRCFPNKWHNYDVYMSLFDIIFLFEHMNMKI